MIINEITYTAKGQVAGTDDIITLQLWLVDRDGNRIGSQMISGHSAVLSGSVYQIDPIDVDSVWVEATDLDYDGHSVKFNNYEYSVPRTGSITRTFRIEPLGAPALTAVAVPEAETFTAATGLPMPGRGPISQEIIVDPATGRVIQRGGQIVDQPFPGDDRVVTGEYTPRAVGVGIGAGIIAVIVLLAVASRKKS